MTDADHDITGVGRLYLLRFSGELSIKGRKTRRRLVRSLVRNLEDALASAGHAFEIERTWSRIFVRSPGDGVVEPLRRVFGVQSVSPAELRSWEGIGDLLDAGEEIFAPRLAGKSFAVRVRRGGAVQCIPFRSTDLERELGSRLLPYAAGVDLEHPDYEAQVEVHPQQAYFFSERVPAAGGLPQAGEGRALALVSGGFDSAVAAWLLLRRGLMLDYLFFNLGGDKHRDGVLAVMKVIADGWSFGYRPRLHMVDLRQLVEQLKERCAPRLWQVILKRLMLRAGEQVARQVAALALVTGEAVGQVSSQTLRNLATISEVSRLPILRPLAGATKEEIMARARQIGTYELSAGVPEFCALEARQAATHVKPSQASAEEARLDLDQLAVAVAERAIFDLRALDLEKIRAPALEVDSVPAGATVIDLRSAAAFRGWHYPGALHLSYSSALRSHASLDRDKTYVLYCEVGLKSAHVAELMHRAGFRAFHFRGGFKNVVRHAERRDPVLRTLVGPALLDD